MSRRSRLVIPTLALLLAACAPVSSAEPVVTTSAGEDVPPQPDLATPDELEGVLVEFGECVAVSFPIAIRYRTDYFVGLETEVGSQLKEEGDAVDKVYADCSAQLDLDRRMSAYQATYPLEADGHTTLASEFVNCVAAISTDAASRIEDANVNSYSATTEFLVDNGPGTGGLSNEEMVAISECHSKLTGPKVVFNDGHPWFSP